MNERRGCLVDTTRCIGCRSCQVACKQSNGLKADVPRSFVAGGRYPNPRRFLPGTFTYIAFHELERSAGEPQWVFVKHQCMHCVKLYCAQVCPADVFKKTASGVVDYKADECIGCGQCIDACPFRVPWIDYWNVSVPNVRKCGFCLGRQQSELDDVQVDGQSPSDRQSPSDGQSESRRLSFQTPACAKACPSGTLKFGNREELLAEAKRRIAENPRRYVDRVYGETEAGGTGWLYLAAVPFERLGLPIEFLDLEMFEKAHLGDARPHGTIGRA
jgi:formate dehydrogenase iron-sulfur subunit